MANHKEVYNRFFEESERDDFNKKVESEVGFKKKIETAKWEQIDNELEKLQHKVDKIDDSFEERFKAYKEAVLKAEKNNTSPISDIKTDIEKKLKEKKDLIIAELKEKAEKKVPFIGSFLFEWARDLMKPLSENATIKDKFFGSISKSIGGFLLTMLGLKKGWDSLKDVKLENAEFKPEKKDKPNVGQEVYNEEDEGNIDEGISTIQKKSDFYYFAGMNTLLYFSGNDADSKKSTLKLLKEKDIKYKDLENLTKEKFLSKEALAVKESVDNFNNTIRGLLNNDSRILLKSSLSTNRLKIIIKDNKTFLKESDNIGNERLAYIDGLLSNNDFNYEELTLNEISLFLYKGMNSLGILGVSTVNKGFDGLKEFITEDSSINLKQVEQELIGKRQGLISNKLWSELGNKDVNFGGKQYMDKPKGDDLFRKEMNLESESIEKDQLEKLINFKDYLLGDFIGQNKNLLSQLGYEEKFKNGLNYVGISMLYITLAGNKDLDKVSVLDLPAVYKIISLIIKAGGGNGNGYLSSIGQYLVLEGDKKNIFENDDKKAIQLVASRFAETYIKTSIKFLKDNLGWSGLFDNKIERSVGAIGLGTIIFKYGGKYIPQFRLPGLILSATGIASLFTDLYGISSSLTNDMNNIFDTGNETKDGKKVVDLERYMANLETLKKKMRVKEIDIDGKKEKVVFYTGEKGLEVIYNKNIYRLDVGPNPLDKSFNLTNIWDQLPDLQISDANKENYKGKKIDFSKIRFNDNNIIFGKGEEIMEMEISKVLNALEKDDIKNPKKLFSEENYADMNYLIVEKLSHIDKNNDLFKWFTERFKIDLILIKVGEIKG